MKPLGVVLCSTPVMNCGLGEALTKLMLDAARARTKYERVDMALVKVGIVLGVVWILVCSDW